MHIDPFDMRTFPSFLWFKKCFLSNLPKNYMIKENENNCWLWQGIKDKNNYGQTSWGSKHYNAHRMSYIIFNGLIPYGKVVRHTCDNPSCVNPKHLILGTQSDNLIDALKRDRYSGTKLTQEDVIEIKIALKNPYRGIGTKLAKKYNVTKYVISRIKNNKSWSWLSI